MGTSKREPPDASAGWRVRTIRTVAEWQALRSDWDRVWNDTPGSTPLQGFAFLAEWWQHMAGDRDLWILVFEDTAGRVGGIAPLQRSRLRLLGKRYRVIEFLGMTEDILRPGMLFPAADRTSLTEALIGYLASRKQDWDLLELDEIPAHDPLLASLEGLARRSGLLYRELPFHDCPYLDLEAHPAATFWTERPKKLIKNLRASERKLAGQGPVSVRKFTTPSEVAEGYRHFLAVERRSWKRENGIGLSSDVHYEPFYAALLDRFARQDGACVMVLFCADVPVAATFAIEQNGTYCSLQIAHDERYSRFSPGTLLEWHEMQELFDTQRARRYEFLGGALTNKQRWTRDAVPTCCVRCHPVEVRLQLLEWFESGLKPAIKQVLRRLGLFKPATPASLQ